MTHTRAVASTEGSPLVVTACLRNRSTVEAFLSAHLPEGARLTIVACGEQWSTVSDAEGPRPWLEDWLGAGALACGLGAAGLSLSPEATAAAASSTAVRNDLRNILRECVGGRELIAKGFAGDVDFAAQLDAGQAVPLLVQREGPPLL